MSRPIRGGDGGCAGLRSAKWSWTCGPSIVQLYMADSTRRPPRHAEPFTDRPAHPAAYEELSAASCCSTASRLAAWSSTTSSSMVFGGTFLLVREENGVADVETLEAAGAECIVVLRAQSSARFLPEEGWELNFDAVPGLGLGAVRVRIFTRWVASGEHSLPRELIVEVRGHAASLEEAIAKFGVVGRPIATMAGFVANVRVGPLELHLAYDCTPGSTDRPFLETFLPDESGAVAEGRIIRQHLMVAACTAFLGLKTDSARISRGLRQYELALREWHLGGEWLALSHLYMAVETLTKAVIRKTVADRGITEEDLAQSLGVVTDDPDRPRWHQILGERVREQIIFDADSDTYQTAKKASDGLEHGFMGLDEVAAHAVKCADKTFHHVRRTIVELLDLPAAAADELMAIKPKDVQSRRKIARCRLIGAAEDPAAEGQLYPLLEWSSSIGSVVREGSTFQISANDKITVRTHPDVSFQLDRLEIYGRLEDGQAPVQMSEQDTLIEPTPEPKSTRMLAAVMPMVDAATASGADIGQIFPRTLAFYLFGQGVAFFQSAHTLINSQQPVETLSALRGLAIIASRFEQITEDSGPGIGVVVRMALDSPGELGADPALDAMYREELLKGATSAGITIPDELPEPEASAIYGSLAFEMRLAQSTVNGTYAAVGLHVKQSDAEHADFRTRLEPGPFTEMVASASVIAQLDLLKRGAKLLGWTVDEQKIDDLLEAARGLNQASANQLMRASSTDPAE